MQTADRNAKILDLYRRDKDRSYAEIAVEIGLSAKKGRNVVSGVINRAGVKNRGGRKLTESELIPPMIGRKFGRLQILGSAGEDLLCLCSCGKKCTHRAAHVKAGLTKSCGCLQKEVAHKNGFKRGLEIKARSTARIAEEIGKKYGRLTVLAAAGQTETGDRKVKCRCDCGREIVTVMSRVRYGNTKSCGCLRYG